MSSSLRIGIIGAGAIAALGHIPGLQKLPGVELVSVCDANLERAQMIAQRFGIPEATNDYHQLLTSDTVDAVTVGVPNALHAPVAIAALQAGKHVLCEKPLAATLDQGHAMVAAAEQSGKVLSINMHNRMRGDMQAMRRLIQGGRLGNLHYVNTRTFRRNGIPGYGGWFTRKELSGGGVLMDIGVHMLDLALWLMGFPDVATVRGEVRSVQGPRKRGLGGWGVDHVADGTFDVEDFATAQIRMTDGSVAVVEVAWATYGRDEHRVQAVGDEAGADSFPDIYGNDTPLRMYVDYEGAPEQIIPPVQNINAFEEAMRRFVEATRGNGGPTATAAEALRTLTVLDAIYRSSAEGREVSL